MKASVHQIQYGTISIEFSLRRRIRRTLSISVHPDQRVDVVAPSDAPLEKVLGRVKRRAQWICRQQRYFEQFRPVAPRRMFVSGETHLYLGRQYRLKVVASREKRVQLIHGRILVHSPRPDRPEITKSAVREWYRQRAELKFRERLEVCRQRFAKPNDYEPETVALRDFKKRWGSMTPGGKLTLNPTLVRASTYGIDYVITHELCHMTYGDHGTNFYRLLNRVMPDWERRKWMLERQLA